MFLQFIAAVLNRSKITFYLLAGPLLPCWKIVKYERAHEIYFNCGYEIYDRVQENGFDRYYMKKYLK